MHSLLAVSPPPCALTIASSGSEGGADADLRNFAAMGVHVSNILPLPPT